MDVKTLFNLLWLAFGGIWMGIGWWIAGLIMIVTVVGTPWAKACFVIGQFAFWPFGRWAVDRDLVTEREDIGTGGLGAAGNILWFVFAGIWLGIGHVVTAAGCFVTIIGIPFGIQHLKLAGLALAPIGKTIVDAS
jgi:uncharacterized membrane protein YccF (DUF307 family)